MNLSKINGVSFRMKFGILIGLFVSMTIISCGGEKTEETPTSNAGSKGIGPVTSVTIGALDQVMADRGKKQFEAKCSACHKFEEKVVGPALQDVTLRRTPEWIMNMILNPIEMTQKDPIGQELLGEHLTQMTFQNIKEEEAREILEYFRKMDLK
ncbi:cytochrome c [Leptospira sp. 85282-16]|uniref:Cytochrome c n=1 Tax=Leptospira montravelensis TaxID=2484961 RepID=A0ABY2LMG2_9LEPT|nr:MULTISPECIES: cytochrome c [Leptospira]MCT8333793.1 cytochrome c [Leptospira sp. 85282-16]TGK80201.1 cytochrome c [Leptospira montravelensis]TGL00371.1 cytochrome c [Leptospira montravelensis]